MKTVIVIFWPLCEVELCLNDDKPTEYPCAIYNPPEAGGFCIEKMIYILLTEIGSIYNQLNI